MQGPPDTDTSGIEEGRRIFTADGLAGELRQGEILTGLVQYVYDEETKIVNSITHEYLVIVSQDCDLLWDFRNRQQNSQGTLYGVTLCQAKPADQIRKEQGINSRIWSHVIQNREERFHALEKVPEDCDLLGLGLGPLVLDFRMMFGTSPRSIYTQVRRGSGATRRSRIEVPYREHLQSRAAFYFQRVALPEPHKMKD